MDKTEKKIEENIKKVYKTEGIQKAIETCMSEIISNPNNPSLHIHLGDLYLDWHLDLFQSRSYIDEAITEYQIALESYIESAEIYFKIGNAFYLKRELDKAISYFNMALEKDPKYVKAYIMIAECHIKKSFFQSAEEYAHKAIKTSAIKSSGAYFMLFALSKIRAKKHFDGFFKRLYYTIMGLLTLPFDKMTLQKVARQMSYIRFIPMLLQGMAEVKTNGLEKALEIYREAVEKAPNFRLLYCLIGEIYRVLGKFDDAICEYKMAIWLDSMYIPAYESLCQTYEEAGDLDNAVETYKKLLEMQPYVAYYHCNLANILYLRGDLEEAISHYQKAIVINPNIHWTRNTAELLGYVFQEGQQNADSAISAYQTAYVLSPNNIDIYINLGSAFFDKGDYDGALTVYRKALDLEPHSAKIHCNMGYLYWNKGNIQEAINEYELAIKYDDEYDIAYNNLGVIYLDDLARIQKAIELFECAVQSNPNYALAYYNLARAITIKGDKIEAAKLYQISLEINSSTQELEEEDIKEKIKELFE